ncbi:MAG TPA: helix-turn-helix domain-containing protein [Terracidiphilus sp.]|jgi:DNA-binding HxlR family transcriptional regulator|nr:helix-turn-helix domain-containing protein [Terracidiphilus sp.]
MRENRRSDCPINLTVELFGDRWSLIVIRDIMFGDRRHYNDLLRLSEEGIASNILADRLNRLVRVGLLTRRKDPTHKQKSIYSLTEASIELVPLMAHMITWARKHIPPSKNPSRGKTLRGQLVEEGGERMWNAFMVELRADHLSAPRPRASVFAKRLAVLEAKREGRTQR